jgi:hypothetical protein
MRSESRNKCVITQTSLSKATWKDLFDLFADERKKEMICPSCRTNKQEAKQFLKYNREGKQVPCRVCKTCRDRRILNYYQKKKIVTEDGHNWSIHLETKAGRSSLKVRRDRYDEVITNSTKTACSTVTSSMTPLPLQLPASPQSPSAESLLSSAEEPPVLLETMMELEATQC